MARVGLVTTFRFVPHVEDGKDKPTVERCWSTLASFLLFHLTKGVEHIFLYADATDDSNDVYIERVSEQFHASQVSVDRRDELQGKRQRATCRTWIELASFTATEVPARQSLNAEDAMHKAGHMGLNWLLHLDVDELFYTAAPSVVPHFDRLHRLGVEQMTYANHEAVPPREDIGDFFSEVDIFRINRLLLPLAGTVGHSTRFWRRRTKHGQYMLAYDNGKSAVRVLPGRIVPESVHRWKVQKPGQLDRTPDQEGTATAGGRSASSSSLGVDATGRAAPIEVDCALSAETSSKSGSIASDEEQEMVERGMDRRLVNRVAMADPRELRVDEVIQCTDPCVLHYPSCGLEWLRDKYRLLGQFPSSWFGGKLPIAPCFHLDARNAMQEGDANTRGHGAGENGVKDDRSRELYHSQVMLCPDEYAQEIRAQVENGVLKVITGPRSVIEHAKKARRTPGSKIWPTCVSSARGVKVDSVENVQKQASSRFLTSTTAEEGLVEQSSPQEEVEETRGVHLSAVGVLESSVATNLRTPADLDTSWILAACARDFL